VLGERDQNRPTIGGMWLAGDESGGDQPVDEPGDGAGADLERVG
jgi:hypothetical protein